MVVVTEDHVATEPVPMPDLVPANGALTVLNSNGDMTDLNVGITVTHPFIGDTQFWLSNPAGATVRLIQNFGAWNDNAEIAFDDQAAIWPRMHDVLVGTFKPRDALASLPLDQASRAGAWTIHGLDTFAGSGVGQIETWSLSFRRNSALDCDGSGVPDACEIADGASPDCNTNGMPDGCESSADCDSNGFPDACDLAQGSAQDCNSNTISDLCDASTDCDTNGQSDPCDTASGSATDCNTDSVPDVCQLGYCLSGPHWDNGGVNGADGLKNQYGGVYPAEVADDFFTPLPTTITQVTFSDVEDATYAWSGRVRVSLWPARSAGEPSESTPESHLVPDTGGSITRVQNGMLFGRTRWDYTIETDLATPGGVQWFSATPLSHGTSGAAFWLTSATPAEFGGSYFRSALIGFPTWTPTQAVLGQTCDFAFTLTFESCSDCNTNGAPDVCDIAADFSQDCNTNEMPDECEDCNTNGAGDACDIAEGESQDCNTNGAPDACDLAPGDCNTNLVPDACEDCNDNDHADACDLVGGTAADCNSNGLPDACDGDCNSNGLADVCDIEDGSLSDCNTNGLGDACDSDCDSNGYVDECELLAGTAGDCNTNAVPDVCDGDCNTNGLADGCDASLGTSDDCNNNVVPDECEGSLGDLIWNNGAVDGTNGLANQINGIAPAETCDDFTTGAGEARIDRVSFSQAEDTAYVWDGTVQVSVWPRLLGQPWEYPFARQVVSEPDVQRVQNGFLFGRPRWDYIADVDLPIPGPGVKWFSATPSSQGFDGQAFWLTGAVPATFGQAYFRSPFFGHDTWVPTQNTLFGDNADFAFTLEFAGDCNATGTLDFCEISMASAIDCDGDHTPDECEDCNTNTLGDICDILGGSSSDCDTNGAPDECDIGLASAADCDGNFILDVCEPDCNTNGVTDECDFKSGQSEDCNQNTLLDECEFQGAVWHNGPPDEIDGVANQAGGTNPAEGVDDFSFPYSTTIVAATFWDVEDGSYEWDGTLDVRLFADIGNHPAETELAAIVATPSRTFEGTLFGRPEWAYDMSDLSIDVPTHGVWWIAIRPRSNGTSGDAFWLTSHTPATNGNGAFWRSAFFGFPTWTSTQAVFGQPLDLAFTLTLDLPADDCNTNGFFDECEAAAGSTADCDGDSLPDACEIAFGTGLDCQTNGVLDGCELAGNDCNTNLQPDECDAADCNTNESPDACEIASGSSTDTDADSVLDICDNCALLANVEQNDWVLRFVDGDGSGLFASIAFDAAGRTAIAAHQKTGPDDGALRLWHDSDADFSVGAGERQTIDTAGQPGQYASLAYDALGRATIAHYAATPADLRLWHDANGNHAFDAGEQQTIDSSGFAGAYASLAFDCCGRACVSYHNIGGGDLKLWHDVDGDFAADAGEIVAIDSAGVVGQHTSLRFDAVGRATVAYYKLTGRDLKLWHDADGDFAFDAGEVSVVADEGDVGQYASLRFDNAGLAVVAYFNDTTNDLHLWHDADGDFVGDATELGLIDATGNVGSHVSLAFDASGRAFAAYQRTDKTNLKLWFDANGNFAADTGEIQKVQGAGDVGTHVSAAFRDVVYAPIIAYRDDSQAALMLTAHLDWDGDGVCFAGDNCAADPNAEQLDSDADGAGDACDVCPLRAPGDMNSDGAADAADIAEFVAVLLDQGQLPPEHACAGDVDVDGDVDGHDVQAFVNLVGI